MKIIYTENDSSECYVLIKGKKYLDSLIKVSEDSIFISKDTEYPEMTLAHELAHLILVKFYDMDKWEEDISWKIWEELNYTYNHKTCDRFPRFIHEYLAWCLAKSMCKEKYWNEDHALDCLHSYAATLPRKGCPIMERFVPGKKINAKKHVSYIKNNKTDVFEEAFGKLK